MKLPTALVTTILNWCRGPYGLLGAVLLAALLGAAPGCAELEKETMPSVQTEGGHRLRVGQSLTIVATTEGGSDSGYGFTSSSPSVASVSAEGVVTGLAEGEADITVTGVDTSANARHPIVVTAEDPTGPDAGLPGDPPGSSYYAAWSSSGHADTTAEAFTYWNAEGAIPESCAKCHSRGGFVDFLGGDATAAGRVDTPAALGTTVDCDACHHPAANALESVTFPSGVEVSGLGGEARCMTCHQGRSSGVTVREEIAAAELTDDDTPSDALSFENIHYFPAASTLLAGVAQGGFQYEGEVYDTRFRHVESFDTCIECHDPHTTRPRFEQCLECHQGATDLQGARDIRMFSSFGRDYDGDGDVSEGIYYELQGSRDRLLGAIQRYGSERASRICYNEAAHPYWFRDTNGDGQCSAEESTRDNRFAAWTARLIKATYNYQMATKDPGAFAHNAKYILELLYDSVSDLNAGLEEDVDLSASVRGDQGHFDGSSEAARHWDEDEEVQASCARCHSGKPGFRFFVENGVNTTVLETANGLECGTCHTSFGTEYGVLEVSRLQLGSQTLQLDGFDNLCGTCHSGRAVGADVDAAIDSGQLRFINVHYLPAAGVRVGTEGGVGYEYEGETYAGNPTHMGGIQCTSCHDPVGSQHSFLIEDAWDARCQTCHADANGDPEAIRLTHLADYDGDGNSDESLAAEISGMGANVLAAMQGAAPAPGICYSSDSYPYFFIDTDSSGACAGDELARTNGFADWTPALLRAAYNYQLSQKEPGAWAHNFDYMAQLLFDSTADLGADTAAMTRP